MEKLILVKDLIKLVVLVILFSIFGTSCEDDSNRYRLKDKCAGVSHIRKCQFEEHDYLLFYNNNGGVSGVTHDPNCRKCKFDKNYRYED